MIFSRSALLTLVAGSDRPIGGDAAPRPIDGDLEPRLIDRLQQVVDRVDLERLDRVLIVGRDEDDLRTGAAADQPPRDLEAGQPRHLHVEKDDVRLQPLDRRQRLDAVAGLADHLDAADLFEQVAQLVPRQLLVVHEHGFQLHRTSAGKLRPPDRTLRL